MTNDYIIDLSKLGIKKVSKKQGMVEYEMKDKYHNSQMTMYELYTGIIIYYNDYKTKRKFSGNFDMENCIQFSYSYEGVYESEIRSNKFLNISAGQLAILSNISNMLSSNMPLGIYKGFNINFYPEYIEQSLKDLFIKDYSIDIEKVFSKIYHNKPVIIINCYDEFKNILDSIYKAIVIGNISYTRIKILEFLFFLSQYDFTIKNEYHVFKKEQIKKVLRIKEIIDFDLTKHHTIQELCELSGLSKTIFKECFKNICLFPPYEYLKRRRINKAAIMLRNNDKTILEISNAVGYENASNFTKVFKSIFGLTPSEYRHMNEENKNNNNLTK